MIKALEEAGIPVDMVGGTSMGALVGGVYAEERDINQTKERTCKWSKVRLHFKNQVYMAYISFSYVHLIVQQFLSITKS